jgi:hypothetical protein
VGSILLLLGRNRRKSKLELSLFVFALPMLKRLCMSMTCFRMDILVGCRSCSLAEEACYILHGPWSLFSLRDDNDGGGISARLGNEPEQRCR